MIIPTQVTVGTSATKLCDIPGGFYAVITNGATAINIGTTNAVTTGTGAPLAANAVLPRLTPGGDGATLWAIVSAGTSVVGVLLCRNG